MLKRLWTGVLAAAMTVAVAAAARAGDVSPLLRNVARSEAEYILLCQFQNPGQPAHGAINNIFGTPTWVVPRENALAVLGLMEAGRILDDGKYLPRARQALDYLISIQPADGGWHDQYEYTAPVILSKSPTQTAEVMIAFYKAGFDAARYPAMKKGAQFLLTLQNPANKKGADDGLIGAGKNAAGQFETWRWASDNSFAYWALKMAEDWAVRGNDAAFAQTCRTAAGRILDGINTYLYISNPNDPDFGVWHRAVDQNDVPVDVNFREWINYAPQMLDLPATGVGEARVGNWIHDTFQKMDGAVVWNTAAENQRKSPGFSFQAALAWRDLGQDAYADAAQGWALTSGLWQLTPDGNNVTGGWIDWSEPGTTADWWLRFIDTSFYAIAAVQGGYDFGIPRGPRFVRGDSNGDGIVDISDALSTLNSLFISGIPPACADAADANDDGTVDISDAIFTLTFLFLGGVDIPSPYPMPGADPTPDQLDCRTPPEEDIHLARCGWQNPGHRREREKHFHRHRVALKDRHRRLF